MAACETCWAAASFRAALGQGATAELYYEELERHPEHESVWVPAEQETQK